MLINVSRSLETAAMRSSTTRGQKVNVEIQLSWMSIMSCVTTCELTHIWLIWHVTQCESTCFVAFWTRFFRSTPSLATTRRDTSWHVARRAQSAAYVWKKEWNWVTWKTAIDSYSNYKQLLYCTYLYLYCFWSMFETCHVAKSWGLWCCMVLPWSWNNFQLPSHPCTAIQTLTFWFTRN